MGEKHHFEGTIVSWSVKVGDAVQEDGVLLK